MARSHWTKERCAEVFEAETGLVVDVGPLKAHHVWELGISRLDLVGATRTASVLRHPLALALEKRPQYLSMSSRTRKLLTLEKRALRQARQLRKTLADLRWRLGGHPELVCGQAMLRALRHRLRIHERREQAFLSSMPGKPGRPQESSLEEGVRALRAIRGAKGKLLSERQITLALMAIGALDVTDLNVAKQRVHDSLRASSRRAKRKRPRGGKKRP